MSGIGTDHSAVSKIQNSKPHRHKHLGLAVPAGVVVDIGEDLGRGTALLGPVVDENLGRHHEQRSRQTFVRYVRNDQGQMIVVNQEKVVKVAADRPGRIHAGIKFKFRMIGKGGERVRQHGDLQVFRHVHFRSDALTLGRDVRKILHIVHDAPLHGLNLPVEIPDLVVWIEHHHPCRISLRLLPVLSAGGSQDGAWPAC